MSQDNFLKHYYFYSIKNCSDVSVLHNIMYRWLEFELTGGDGGGVRWWGEVVVVVVVCVCDWSFFRNTSINE